MPADPSIATAWAERAPYTIRAGGSRICFVRDPDGYRIELIEAGPSPA